MTQTYKRFWYDFEDPNGPKMVDMVNGKKYALETIGDFRNIEKMLNELDNENEQLKDENKKLKELLELISRADSFIKEESVKEILRNKIKGLDTVTEYSAGAWHDYCILSNFFEKEYGEEWDDE